MSHSNNNYANYHYIKLYLKLSHETVKLIQRSQHVHQLVSAIVYQYGCAVLTNVSTHSNDELGTNSEASRKCPINIDS